MSSSSLAGTSAFSKTPWSTIDAPMTWAWARSEPIIRTVATQLRTSTTRTGTPRQVAVTLVSYNWHSALGTLRVQAMCCCFAHSSDPPHRQFTLTSVERPMQYDDAMKESVSHDAALAAQSCQEILAGGGRVFLVGGAAMALAYDAGRATLDIDAVFQPRHAINEAVRLISERHQLPPDWLNDTVKVFVTDSLPNLVLACAFRVRTGIAWVGTGGAGIANVGYQDDSADGWSGTTTPTDRNPPTKASYCSADNRSRRTIA